MKKLIALLALVTGVATAATYTYDYPVTRVIDGDTVEFRADFLPKPLKPVLSLRVLGVDTPEKGSTAKCPEEKALGIKASNFTKELLARRKTTQVVIQEWDKYGGRVLGDVIFDGQSLRQLLLDNGYARPYDGGKKSSWCTK